ncbi:MAG: N-acetylmuramoyl-L-alanine amidase [Hyphomicrobiales bacterium]|nr:N-acetylmuramoyl-L-alanine amidase [Hyphomicrobiales bacterium]MDE2116176.1 N-acetylmuramoyl-L-alanine amidase [Hyphomicrobiales bacterium]
MAKISSSSSRFLRVFGIPFGIAALTLVTAGPTLAANTGAEAPAQNAPAIVAVSDSISIHKDETVLSFEFNRAAPLNAYVLANPDRVIIDLPEINFQVAPPDLAQAHRNHDSNGLASVSKKQLTAPSLVRNFRFGLMGQGKSRIVIDLAAPVRLVHAEMKKISHGDPARLEIALQPASRAEFMKAAALASSKIVPDEATQPAQAVVDSGKPVIVLDPGHGGIDSGAINTKANSEEKNLTLAFANRLRQQLEASGQYSVIMTRDSDHYVSLSERVKIGREAHAKLFISLHADSLAGGGGVHGATVYTLSNKASDIAAERMAAEENSVDSDAGLVTQNAEPKDVNDILNELMLRETRAYSHLFAESVAKTWGPAEQMSKRPLRSASFVVLKDPEVPSVLIELGYISSRRDLANLTSDTWREKTARTFVTAINAFFATQIGAVGSVQKIANSVDPTSVPAVTKTTH